MAEPTATLLFDHARYDGFGNRTHQTVTKGSGPMHSVTIVPATNRILEQPYDANGNAGYASQYDIENRRNDYWYSASNQRLMTRLQETPTLWFYGIDDELLGQFDMREYPVDSGVRIAVLKPETERIYAGGRLLLMGGQAVTTDRLGSVVRHGTQNLSYYPYGEEIGGATTQNRAKFATYTRDPGGDDYAWNRQYWTVTGRFTTPDPYRASGGAADPGSWNRYSYVGNDPVNFNDPAGLQKSPLDEDRDFACVNMMAGMGGFAWAEYVCFARSGGGGGGGSSGITEPGGGSAGKGASSTRTTALQIAESVMKNEALNECEKLARFASDLADSGLSNSSFVSSFLAITPRSGTAPWMFMAGGVDWDAQAVHFGGDVDSPDNGYQSQYKDGYGSDASPLGNDADQGHHFAAYFQLGFRRGSTLASFAGYFRDLNNPGDQNLAYKAAAIGSDLLFRRISTSDVGGRIMREICDHGQP